MSYFKGKPALLNSTFSRAGFLIPIFSPRNIILASFTIVTGVGPVDFPLEVLVISDFSPIQFLLAKEPFAHKSIHCIIVEVETYGRRCWSIVGVVIANSSVRRGIYLARVTHELKQTNNSAL